MLDDWRTAPIDERLRALLGFIETLTLTPQAVSPADIAPLRAAGLSDEAIEEGIHVCALFSIYDRAADALEFDVPDADGFKAAAATLLQRGYR